MEFIGIIRISIFIIRFIIIRVGAILVVGVRTSPFIVFRTEASGVVAVGGITFIVILVITI